jgi:predicted GNAT superfamily acetyltransferase
MLKTRIIVRPLVALQEFRECERIQQNVWGAAGASAELLQVTQKNGGLVLGSFSDRQLVGFLYAFIGRRQSRLIHWSHLMAVEEDFRDHGLGFRMKLEHRKRALAAGIRMIAWTFDPLQSRNAALNLGGLGARVDEFLPNCYGQFQNAIEHSLASDRFVAAWLIGTRRVARRLAGEDRPKFPASAEVANETKCDARGLPVNICLRLNLTAPRLLVEIPRHTDRMRELDIKLAARWREETRRIFQRYLRAGYRVGDFIRPSNENGGRPFYVLTRPSSGSS